MTFCELVDEIKDWPVLVSAVARVRATTAYRAYCEDGDVQYEAWSHR